MDGSQQAVDPNSGFFQAPLNQFYHFRRPPSPDFNVVTPNSDTLYSIAWLDLNDGPLELQVPEIPDRYYSFQFVDMYTFNYTYVGTRATGTAAGTFLVPGPLWEGDPGPGVTALERSDGRFVALLGRTEIKGGEADLAIVNAIQDQYVLTPPVGYNPSPIEHFPVYDDAKAKSPPFVDYMNYLFTYLKIEEEERSMIEAWSRIGIEIRFGPVAQTPDPDEVQAAIDAALATIDAGTATIGELDPDTKWNKTLEAFGSRQEMVGYYGYTAKLYETRASAAMFGLYGNTQYEAYYPKTSLDGNAEILDSSQHDYTITFAPGTLPPVEDEGFWSVTIYKQSTYGFVPNELDRYSLGERSPLVDEDGTIVLYLQQEPKTYTDENGEEAIHPNWLPAPGCPGDTATEKEEVPDYRFYLVCRLYVPMASAVTDSGYTPPAVVPVP